MAIQTEKRLDVVRRLARDLGPGQYITNKGLVEALCKRYPEFGGHRNPIVAADFSANSKSGYSYPKIVGLTMIYAKRRVHDHQTS